MANENIERLLAQINEALDGMEAVGAHAGDVKSVIRRVASLRTSMEALNETNLVGADDYEFLDKFSNDLSGALPVKSDEMAGWLALAQKALDAGDLLPGLPVDRIRETMDRAEAVFAAKPSTAKKATVRGIGVPIRVECGCGSFTRESTGGDWTSIRYQAKKHADECNVACNDETGEFTLHFDNARRAIVDSRLPEFKAGGLTFSLA